MIKFTVDLDPVPKGRPRFWKGRAVTDEKTRAFEREFALMASTHRPKVPFAGPVVVGVDFILRRPRTVNRLWPTVKPDTDNLIKSLLDSLSAFWLDDAQVVGIAARKFYTNQKKGRIEVEIHELG